MKSINIPAELKKMNELFEKQGYSAYLVGGAVRDVILGKAASDWDVATNATPKQVMGIFHKVIPTGIAHGTVTVHFMKKEIEVTTFRTETGYSDGRHPDSVAYAATIEEDLSRRDFTMNAIAARLSDGTIIDPFSGREDIKNKIIRTVGNPHERFMEDGLRPIRAIRFSSQLKFQIEKNTYEELFKSDIQKKITSISMERFRDELEKILKTDEPSKAFLRLEETGLLRLFMKELAIGRGVSQKDSRGFHEFDVLDHNLYAADGAPKNNEIVRLASLLHDIGKTPCRTVETKQIEGKEIQLIHFHGHEGAGSKMAKELLTRLKFPNALIDKVCHLIKEHMFFYEHSWSDAAVRRFIVRVGKENIEDLILLRYADIFGMHRCPVESRSETVLLLNELKDRIRKVEEEKSAQSLKDLAVNGRDLMEAGIPAGKTLGYILNELFQCVLDDPGMNTKEKLMKVALHIKESAVI